MRTKRAIWITLLCAALVGALLLPNFTVRAESVTVTFDAGGYPYSGLNGNISSAQAHSGTYSWERPSGTNTVTVRIDLPGITHVSKVCLWTYKDSGPPYGLGYLAQLYNSADALLGEYIEYENWSRTEWVGFCHDFYVDDVSYVKISLASDGTFDAWMDDISITYTAQYPTITPTPTATLPAVGIPYPACLLLMGEDSVFRNFPGRWLPVQGTAENPTGQTSGLLLPPGSEVEYPLTLYEENRYAIRVFWRIATPSSLAADQQFFVGINDEQFGITLSQDSDEHNYTVPPANYSPLGVDGYSLRLSNPSAAPDVGLEITYICVVNTTQQGGNSAYVPASCQACTFVPSLNPFELISNLFAWLVCVVRRLFECELIAVLEGIWSVVNDILLFCASFGLWLSRTLSAFIGTQGENAVITARYVGGHLNNVGSAINIQANSIGSSFDQAIFQSGLADSSNQISGGVQNIPIAVGNGLNQIGQLMNSTVNVGVDAIGLIGNLINLFLQAIGYLLYIVPIIFSSIVDGFNTGAFAPISGSPTCSAPTTLLYYPCLGFYVLDNTVFQGPAFYLAPVLLAVMAYDTLTWAIQRFKDAFSK